MALAVPFNFAGHLIASAIQSPLTMREKIEMIAPWVVSGVVIVLGLLVYGRSDLLRAHWARVWAISSVCFTESVRKRVLWIAPLAIVGVIVIGQFQHPDSPRDAIRQTTKFCLFASGLVVIITTIILSATSLPREIENRIIYTIVTKPTTRLEIVLGKIVGFARVSGLIILIMGVFTLAYLHLRARPMLATLKEELAELPADSPNRPSYEYYVNSGLLGTRSMEWGQVLQIYSRPPTGDEHWMLGGEGQYFLSYFDLTSDELNLLKAALDNEVPVRLKMQADILYHTPDSQQIRQFHDMGLSRTKSKPNELGPPAPTAPEVEPPPIPQVAVRFLDRGSRPLGSMTDQESGLSVTVDSPPDPHGPAQAPAPGALGVERVGSSQVDPAVIRAILEKTGGRFWVQVSGRTPATEFGVRGRPISFYIDPPNKELKLPPMLGAMDPANPGQQSPLLFYAYPSRHGMRLAPVIAGGEGPLAMYGFRNVDVTPGADGKVGVQIAVSVDKAGEFDDRADASISSAYSAGSIEVRNYKTHTSSGEILFSPETSRAQPVSVDAKFFDGGTFDILLRNKTPQQYLGVEGGQNGSIALVTADRSFVFNLTKSLFILWLLSILVIIIAVFTSTFLSWPIAVVLTLLLLLGHWGVTQLGDALNSGTVGRNANSELGVVDPSMSRVVDNTMEALARSLKFVSAFMPDISAFAVTEDIERGESIPAARIRESLGVLFCYGAPMFVFSYVILRRKEVAP